MLSNILINACVCMSFVMYYLKMVDGPEQYAGNFDLKAYLGSMRLLVKQGIHAIHETLESLPENVLREQFDIPEAGEISFWRPVAVRLGPDGQRAFQFYDRQTFDHLWTVNPYQEPLATDQRCFVYPPNLNVKKGEVQTYETMEMVTLNPYAVSAVLVLSGLVAHDFSQPT